VSQPRTDAKKAELWQLCRANAAANVKEKGGYELSKIGSFLCHSDRSAGISSYSVFTKK
jgi:hypothetical protein